MTDVLVVGGGPAGLGAAEWLAGQGLRVVLAERQAETGGTPRFCGHSPFGMREFRRLLTGRAYARRLTEAALKAGAEVWCQAAVTAIGPDLVADITTPDESRQLAPRAILLATGAREATGAERLLPGERPQGVVTTGTLQQMWFAGRALPFLRPVILGTELVAMSALLTCWQAGAQAVAVIEPGAQPLVRAPFRWLPRVMGVPLHLQTEVADLVARDGRLAEVVLSGPGGHQSIKADGLVLTGSFRPESALAREAGLVIDPSTRGPVIDTAGQSTRPGIFVAGNALRGIETAGWCWAEGRAVAAAILRHLSTPVVPGKVRVLAGAGVSLLVPQRVSPGAAACDSLQVRLAIRTRGVLDMQSTDGRILWSRAIASGPERRVLVPLGAVPKDPAGPLTLTFRDL